MFDCTSSEISGRFVLLRHTFEADQSGNDHWDLMFECGEVLKTLRLLRLPANTKTGADRLPARRIADHRSAYLDYEGPVSGGRGSVARLAVGKFTARRVPIEDALGRDNDSQHAAAMSESGLPPQPTPQTDHVAATGAAIDRRDEPNSTNESSGQLAASGEAVQQPSDVASPAPVQMQQGQKNAQERGSCRPKEKASTHCWDVTLQSKQLSARLLIPPMAIGQEDELVVQQWQLHDTR